MSGCTIAITRRQTTRSSLSTWKQPVSSRGSFGTYSPLLLIARRLLSGSQIASSNASLSISAHQALNQIRRAPVGTLRTDAGGAASNAIGYAKFRSRSHHAVIRVYDEAGNVIEKHEGSGAQRARPGLGP